MKTKQQLIEMNKEINNIIPDQAGTYTEQDKIGLIEFYINSHSEVDIGVNENAKLSIGEQYNDNENYPLIVALKTEQLKIADYLLDLKNVISADMLLAIKSIGNLNPMLHLFRGKFKCDETIKMFDKIFKLYEAQPTYHEKNSPLKPSVDRVLKLLIFNMIRGKDSSEIIKITKALDDQGYPFSPNTFLEAITYKNGVIDILQRNENLLESTFLHACANIKHQEAKFLLAKNPNIINARDENGKNALELYVEFKGNYGLQFQISQEQLDFYDLLCEKGLDHGEASKNFTKSYYNNLSFAFAKNPLAIIKTLIKMDANYQKTFNLEDNILSKKVVDAATEHNLWTLLQKNQPELIIHNVVTGKSELIVSGLNKILPTKLDNLGFDQLGSLKNLALLKMFDNSLPNKQFFVAIKNDAVPQDLIDAANNYMKNLSITANEYGLGLAQENTAISAIGEQSATESAD